MSGAFKGFFQRTLGIGVDKRFEPTSEELARGLEREEVVLLDIRSPAEYERGHIPGARLVPPMQLDPDSLDVPRDTPIVCYCASGGRSEYARGVLTQAGFSNVRNFGGVDRWTGTLETGSE